ncbi:TPA: TIGR00730 family Rossman fold protein [Candidatus Saccharibacteria bacterium]|nr:MAG: Rossman fold protein, TIGR00730 family [Candidatus Saccharibacteria bacterium RIFCSPHIGHO2_12_FULL_47_17]HCM51826.1 TIGR00730 family Rossman fold protein [Candidatus Saccharibacteria bacterium]
MNICIFCSAVILDEKYIKPAEEVASLIAKAGHHLVWGGSHVGTMKAVADTVRQYGGKIYGVSLMTYKDKAHKTADEMIVAKDLGERKAAMLEKSDVLIALAGGIGTLDEIMHVLELRKQDHHNKPVIIINSGGFYDGLYNQLQRMRREGFIVKKLEDLIYFANTPKAAMEYISQL